MLSAVPVSVAEYDYLIVGGGASGLSLAYHLAQEPRLADKRVLLVEPDAAKADDRTWRYWATGETLFAAVESHRWEQLLIRTPGFEQVARLSPYRYRMVRAGDFYRFVEAALAARPQQFERLTGSVATLAENAAGTGAVATLTDGRQVAARYVFDSRLPKLVRDPTRYRYLEQHFLGWEIETDEDEFDPQTMQFMDFRVAQRQQARFVYALPFSHRRALVEFTVFSEKVLPKAEYETELRAYMANYLHGRPYRILAEEGGSIPMTDHPLPARLSAHILHVGTRAGRSKPSTGYTFARVQRHSARLVAALASTGHPPADATGDKWQFRLFDTLLLDIMQRQGESTRDIFRQLFERNPVQRIFRFLDEQTSWRENLQIMNSVSAGPFLRSIGQVLRGRPGQRDASLNEE
jgi:lycopene beta-cyclase